MEIKRNISFNKNSTSGPTYKLTIFGNKYVWYLCRDFNDACPFIKLDREVDYHKFYIPFEEGDLDENL